LSLVFCEDDFIHELNLRYRGKDSPTDVLSFLQDAAGPDPDSGPLLGDVVISLPTARRQAANRNQSLAREVEWLFLHGALHCAGYDDDTDEAAGEMDQRARLVLDRAAAQGGRSYP
jgi:probable rRNA maturation factor